MTFCGRMWAMMWPMKCCSMDCRKIFLFTSPQQKKAHSFTWSDKALGSLIKHNPGRVFSSEELLNKHGSESVSNSVRLTVVEKLLEGEKSQQREAGEANEAEFLPSDTSVSKAISLLNDVSDLNHSQRQLDLLLDVLIRKGAVPVLAMLRLEGLYSWLASSKLTSEKDPRVFLELSQLIFAHDPSILSKQNLAKILSWGMDSKSAHWAH
ncbi:hypothetical protein JCM33374_g755 [Metschnikowia sp. JCM 33374]|nr:hypothetical protein JCM33374_g755 [Metschnikowia sp. JCM 33374]